MLAEKQIDKINEFFKDIKFHFDIEFNIVRFEYGISVTIKTDYITSTFFKELANFREAENLPFGLCSENNQFVVVF